MTHDSRPLPAYLYAEDNIREREEINVGRPMPQAADQGSQFMSISGIRPVHVSGLVGGVLESEKDIRERGSQFMTPGSMPPHAYLHTSGYQHHSCCASAFIRPHREFSNNAKDFNFMSCGR